jgi:alanine racemase
MAIGWFTSSDMQTPFVTVQLDQLARNIAHLKQGLTPGCKIMFVVKSDAYGHGIGPVSACAVRAGVDWFAVAYFEEALEVRRAAPEADILVLGPILPEEVSMALEEKITPVVVDVEHAQALGAAALHSGKDLRVHLKVDTGMGRLGILESGEFAELPVILNTPGLNVTGICSHLATVDLKRPWLQEKQHHRFVQAYTQAEQIAGKRLMRHFSSSRGIQYYPEWDHDAVRPGILLYGYGTQDPAMRFHTQPFLQMTARLMQVKSVPEHTPVGYYSSYQTTRDTQIGVVGVGYADGYLRSLSNRGEALIRGTRVPVVGRISMNWITLDLGPDLECQAGDEVVLLGQQENEQVWADWLGRRAGTIAYELLTAIHPRIPRKYL